MGGKESTLQKYASRYRTLYPSSTHLVVPADALRFWPGKPLSMRSALQSVVKDIQGHISAQGGQPPRILLHVMSNGGVCTFTDLASTIRKQRIQAPPGTKCAIILDSAPAPVTFIMMVRAFTVNVHNRYANYLSRLVVSLVIVGTSLVRAVLRLPKLMERELIELNDPALLPWTSLKTPRLYLYSSGDLIIPPKGVEEHAARAQAAGFPVRMVQFGESPHVAHAVRSSKKYWSAVHAFWEETVK
ncbi:hypothetical protein BD413DRAFT_92486 [Trametes elegans]|nr:hypothetical protein BD413DRAFT_92486 [Trametes elegans]